MSAPQDVAGGPEAAGGPPEPEPSIAALLADLAAELRTLLRLEIALFRLELAEKLRRVRRGLAAIAAGVFFAFSAWLALLAAAVLGLAHMVAPWLAALLVGLSALLSAALLLWLGARWLAAKRLVPARTLTALRQDRAWFKERVS